MAVNVKTPDILAEANFTETRLAEEIDAMKYEPLHPVEKKLIAVSLVLGLVLLIVFTWVGNTVFPGS